MLKSIFFEILNMSITASFAIASVMVLRYFFRKQPKTYSYVLWSVVLFRLLCPWSVPLNISAFNVVPPAQTSNGHIEYSLDDIIPIEENLPVEISPIDNMPVENKIIHSTENSVDFSLLVSALWVLGVIYIISNNILAMSELKKLLTDSVQEDGNIYRCKNISTAFVSGIISPVIYLPENLPDRQRAFIIRHERIHIKRFDYLFKHLAFIALSLHWFNPLVWMAFRFAEKDMEMSCDEAVIKEMNKRDRFNYSQTILRLAAGNNALPQLAFGESDTKGRIMNIFNYKKPGVKFAVILSIIILRTVTAFAVNPVSEPEPMDNNVPVLDESTRNHTVAEGDTVWHIAELYDMDIEQLYEFNPDKDFSNLAVGETLVVRGQPKVPGEAYSFWIKPDETKTVMAETAFMTYFKTLEIQPASEYILQNLTIITDAPGEDFHYVLIGDYISPADKESNSISQSILYVRDDEDGNYTITGAEGAYSGEYRSAFIDENYEYIGTGIKFVWPTALGRVSRGFTGQYPSHNGMDIAAPAGTEIFAAADGIVTVAEELTTGNGIYCVIDHGGISTLYAHCSELLVEVGDEVKQGDIIAKTGSTGNSTGPHVHFEVFDNENEIRVDPYVWF